MARRNLLFGMLLVASNFVQADDSNRVLIIGIDGCRPDALQAAGTPNLDSLIAHGSWFDGTDIRDPQPMDSADTISGPGWSNLLHGVWPDKHGVLDNKFTAPNYERYPHVFQRIREVRPDAITASFSSWPPIARTITQGATVSRNFPNPDPDGLEGYRKGDSEAADACVEYLRSDNPTCVVLYFGQVDETGHTHGFHPSVAEYKKAIETVDGHIGRVNDAVSARSTSRRENWLTIVCTDHGGAGTDHGKGHDNPDIRRTFLIVSGDAASRGAVEVGTWQVDVVPTALKHLGIEPKPEWELDGRPVGLR